MDALERAVDRADLDDLVHWVDRLASDGAWDELLRLRDLSRAALERGRQLWPIASYSEYRAALDAPGEWAARVLVPGTGAFALGPLSEVAASTHTWDELAPHVEPGPVAALAAYERSLRGDVVPDEAVAAAGLELPAALAPWEPAYPLATYTLDRVDAPRPPTTPSRALRLPAAPDALAPDGAADALSALARNWASASNGRVDAVAVEGTAAHAIAALGAPSSGTRAAELDVAGAAALMAWAAASAGAHGRRRGTAIGRFDTWWALAALTGLDATFPPDRQDLGGASAELRFYEWDAGEPETGWVLRLAVEDPVDGLAWALAATDAA